VGKQARREGHGETMQRMSWAILLILLMMAMLPGGATEAGTAGVALDARMIAARETPLGNLTADALRQATGAEIAMVYALAFRDAARIDKGMVLDDAVLRACFAFPTSKIATLKLTPDQLKVVMQRAMSKYPERNTAFLQISGMRVQFDSSKPIPNRIISIRIGDKNIDLSDTSTKITVAMPRELAQGAVGYLLIFNNDIAKSMDTTDITLLDALHSLARLSKEITPKVEDRLIDLNEKIKDAKTS